MNPILFDEEDDFFNHSKRRKVDKNGKHIVDPFVQAAQEVETDGSQSDSSSQSSTSDRRRPSRRAYQPRWGRTSSLPSKKNDHIDSLDATQASTGMSVEDRASSRSPSLTPPPPIDKETREKLRQVINNSTNGIGASLMEDDGDESMDLHDERFLSDLDPALARYLRGRNAVTSRRLLAKRIEETRDSHDSQEDDSGSKVVPAAIELSDTESEDNGQPIQDNRSSSPIEVVSFTQAYSTKSPVESDRSNERAVEQFLPDDDDAERLQLTMKGGHQGTLVATVHVRPTTKIQRLAEHFISVHKQRIPKPSHPNVRIRFDGDVLDPNDTVVDVGIEDEEQLDVIW